MQYIDHQLDAKSNTEWVLSGESNKPDVDVTIPERAVIKFKARKELKLALKKLDLQVIDKG